MKTIATESVMPGATSKTADMTITCYMNEIPAFIESELSRLYNTLHSSLPFFRIFRSIDKVSSYVAWRSGEPTTILLFRLEKGRIDVLNEMIEISQAEVLRFCQYVFLHFREVNLVSFKAMSTTMQDFPYPSQKHDAKDTYAISLPSTEKEYRDSLGKSTRTSINYQMNKVKRDHPSFSSSFYENDDIDESYIHALVRLSEERISSKVSTFSHDEERIRLLSKACGFVHVLRIDGRICGGSINYRIGSNYFGEVIAHSPEYEKYGIGKLGMYLNICECIARGGKRFYLGGGRFEFKSRLKGINQTMDKVEIYRSYGQMLFNMDRVGITIASSFIRRLKVSLHTHKEKVLIQRLFQLFYKMKSMKSRIIRQG